MTAVVLLGPKTRLGAEVIKRSSDSALLVVARGGADAAQIRSLRGLSPDDVVDGSSGTLAERVAGLGSGPVRLIVAALGPVHPGPPRTSEDAAVVSRDLGLIAEVLASSRCRVEVVFVSTVLAIAPREERRYYGGWKALLEQQLQQLVDEQEAAGGSASLSVLYPGRLLPSVERRGRRRLHTSYTHLAEIALSDTVGRPSNLVIGWDSRLVLMARSISLALRSLRSSTRRALAPVDTPR